MPTPTPTVIGTGKDTLALMVFEDAWNGDAQFTVSIDGKQVGGLQTATASHGAHLTQEIDVRGDFGAGAHMATINFLNDAWGGTAATDRNLYVKGIDVDGSPAAGISAALYSEGTAHFQITVPTH